MALEVHITYIVLMFSPMVMVVKIKDKEKGGDRLDGTSPFSDIDSFQCHCVMGCPSTNFVTLLVP